MYYIYHTRRLHIRTDNESLPNTINSSSLVWMAHEYNSPVYDAFYSQY